MDIHIFRALLQKLDELEERGLLNDPEVVAGLHKAREDHLAGRLMSHIDLIKELGLEGGPPPLRRLINLERTIG